MYSKLESLCEVHKPHGGIQEGLMHSKDTLHTKSTAVHNPSYANDCVIYFSIFYGDQIRR
jgi:hypothetical protein